MSDTELIAEKSESVALAESEFASLLQREFKPKSDEAKSAVEQAVRTLAEQALSQTKLIGTDVLKSIEAIVAALDQKLTEQINLIMHHPDFQKLEGTWRGLHYLINNTETDEMLKIRVMNISKSEFGKTLKRFKGTKWDQSPLFKKVYEEEYGVFGGEPFGCLVGDFAIDHSPPDVELLGEMAKVSAAAHSPFIAGASPTTAKTRPPGLSCRTNPSGSTGVEPVSTIASYVAPPHPWEPSPTWSSTASNPTRCSLISASLESSGSISTLVTRAPTPASSAAK